MPTYKITKHNKMVCVVDVYLAKGEKTFSFFNAPDNHWDNPKCQRELLKRDLDKAKEKNAIIILGGCVIGIHLFSFIVLVLRFIR